MLKHLVIAFLGAVSYTTGNVVSNEKPLDQTPDPEQLIQTTVIPIFQLAYTISDTKIVDFISDVVIDHPNNYNLDTAAVLNILNVTEKNLSYLIQQVDHKHFLDVIGVRITDIVWQVVNQFPNRDMLPPTLQALGIDLNKYAEATAFVNQELMFQLLKSADFSNEALNQVEQISGLTLDGIMQIIKPVIVNAMATTNIDIILKELEDEMDDFIDIIFSNLTLSDALNNPILTDIINNYTKAFNLGSPLVIPIGPHRLITLMDAASTWEHSRKYMDGYLINIEDDSVVLRVRSINTNCTYAVVEVDEINSSYFNRTGDYSTIPNSCVYITQSTDGLIEVRNVTSHQIREYIINTDNVYGEIPQFGTPLICDNLVYGLFVEENDNQLLFLTLHDDMPDDWVGFDDNDEPAASMMIQASFSLIFASVLFIFS